MKKTMAFILALALACSLCVPALAAEDVPVVEDETDPVDEYIAAHPEEMAALDVDALLENWGYRDPREEFMEYWGDMADTFEEAVARHYVSNRVDALWNVSQAEEYKTQYPEDWAAFDAYRYFAADVQANYMDGAESVESYMAYYNLLSEDEFIAMMFVECISVYGRYDPTDWEYDWDEPFDPADPDAQPTLTLVVNGVASDVAIFANDWTTYADAAELRGILGVKAVAPTYEGPVPVREAAENAGWEVQWYDGGWKGLDQQVCLWNKDAFVAEVKARTEPYQKLWDASMERFRNTVFTETPQRATQTATVTFKRFNSLDGDKTYTLKLRAETVWQKGVLDCTVTFDVAQLLGMFTADELEGMAQDSELSLTDLKRLFSAGKAEFIIDYNAGGMACNIPLLGLIDRDLEGWQTTYSTMLGYSQENVNYAELLYENMLITASWMGGLAGREEVDDSLEALGVFAGPDNVQTTGSNVTWTLETEKVNAALSKLIGDGAKTFSFFKKCDVNMTFNAQGEVDMVMALRPDTDGIVEAAAAEGDETNALANSFMRWLLGCLDMDLTATAQGNRDESTETLKLHIKNFGVFDVNTQSTTKSAAQGPRQLAQVEREWVKGDVGGGDKS